MTVINQREKCHLLIFFAVILSGVFTFGIVNLLARTFSQEKLNGYVFNGSVATIMDNFENSNMKIGNFVLIKEVAVKKLKVGDYVVFNDFIGGAIRRDNCGKFLEISSQKDYLFIESEVDGEVFRLPCSLYFGKVELCSQFKCGWIKFISTEWANFFFILVPFVFVWGVVELFRYNLIEESGHSDCGTN